jgi:hypothetical protein
MAQLKMPADAAKALTAPERLLLLCVAAGIDRKPRAGAPVLMCPISAPFYVGSDSHHLVGVRDSSPRALAICFSASSSASLRCAQLVLYALSIDPPKRPMVRSNHFQQCGNDLPYASGRRVAAHASSQCPNSTLTHSLPSLSAWA